MMLSDISVRRPVFAAVIAMLICIVGVIAFRSLSVREYPDTDPPVVSVETEYIGAAANVVEERITQPLEDSLAGIAGIRSITSSSQDGESDISIEFSPTRDIDEAANDVRDRVGRAVDDLPDEVRAPEIRKVETDAHPILYFVVSRPGWSRLQLSDYADRQLVDRFSAVDGVARVFVGGDATPAMRIWLKPERLAAYQLTPSDIETALRTQNVELPAGRLESEQQNMTLRVDRPFVTPADFARLVVGRGADGYLVRLGDVARIAQGAENPYGSFHSNGGSAVGLGIIRQSGANTLQVAEDAKAVARELQPDLPDGMTITVGSDESVYIGRAIDKVYHTLLEAAILVVLVIFLFLGSARATLIPALTVPICLLGTFATLWFFGLSINLLTLLALVLAIGLVVDDAIVVLENVYHRIEEGEGPLVAAYRGTRQVGFAIISTTLVVCAVFVPIMFLPGQTGLLFRELAIAMIAALAFSGFVALSLAPMLCSKLLKTQQRGRFTGAIDRGFTRLERGYGRWLDGALARPLLPLAIVAIFLAGAAYLFTTLNSELAPSEDTGILSANIIAPEGTGYDQMEKYAAATEAEILKLVRKDGPIRTVLTRTPGGYGSSDDFNSARFTIYLKPWEERTQSTSDVANEVNHIIGDQPAVRGNAAPRSGLAGGSGEPISMVISGNTYEGLARARDRILAAAAMNPGIVDLESDYKETKPQLHIDVNTTRAGALGVSIDQISTALQTLLGSTNVTTYVDRGQEYRVVLQAEREGRSTIQDLARIYVRSGSGQLVPLSNLVTTREEAGARELGRFNKLRSITLEGALAPGYSLGDALNFLETEARKSPEVTAIGYQGESQQFRETGGSIWIVFGMTVLIVYLLLAAQFESFVHPAVIITTVPLAVGGGVIGIAIAGGTLNLFSQIGIVMLVGLAAKNGILIVEFANQLRDEGMELGPAIRRASTRRLRPILMTSIATVVGAIPLVATGGAGSESRAAIGAVIVAGVSIATLITLFLIPILYSRFAKGTVSPETVSRRLEAELAETDAHPQAAE